MRADTAEQLKQMRAAQSYAAADSADALIAEYSPLVRKIAWQVYSKVSRTHDLDDLIQTGLIALIEAKRQYQDRGYAFSTYATTRIRGAMIDQLRRDADVGRSAMAANRRIQGTRAKLEQQLMRGPTSREMAEAMNMSAEAFFDYEQNAQQGRSTSLDELMEFDHFMVADENEGGFAAIEDADMKQALIKAIVQLPEREQLVLQLYFTEDLNLQEIGMAMDVSAARICQIKRSAMATIEKLMLEMTELD
ncbi:sigma-70 family RNA polymerase sigma factor [Sphingopyxis yananensis]|uniref:sigma-70 family RNA polymerase sigma factor n=1 Tax=Sphingopyxis yananensis TaxID=2886687 RepID=UPI001D107984|nr:FliA/WhiG family RNA polymerase sigma factor [Sphingopyxis yananensis]MCC2601440.1 FliA/WhiG family RNA polymerase sigma factor [Sphingopyxis yananensis]